MHHLQFLCCEVIAYLLEGSLWDSGQDEPQSESECRLMFWQAIYLLLIFKVATVKSGAPPPLPRTSLCTHAFSFPQLCTTYSLLSDIFCQLLVQLIFQVIPKWHEQGLAKMNPKEQTEDMSIVDTRTPSPQIPNLVVSSINPPLAKWFEL